MNTPIPTWSELERLLAAHKPKTFKELLTIYKRQWTQETNKQIQSESSKPDSKLF